MNHLLGLPAAFSAGLALGAFYFWTLWLTVRRLPDARRPWLLSLGSFWGRMAVTLSGFHLATQGRWENLAACLVGYFLMRTIFLRHSATSGTGRGTLWIP
jgi:F1F0 ATPase subunit 2